MEIYSPVHLFVSQEDFTNIRGVLDLSGCLHSTVPFYIFCMFSPPVCWLQDYTKTTQEILWIFVEGWEMGQDCFGLKSFWDQKKNTFRGPISTSDCNFVQIPPKKWCPNKHGGFCAKLREPVWPWWRLVFTKSFASGLTDSCSPQRTANPTTYCK